MLKRSSIGLLVLIALVLVPVASAAEPLSKGIEGSFKLEGTNGFKLFGLIGSTGKAGLLMLFVERKDSGVTYVAHGEVSAEHVHFDLGRLGEIDLSVQPTGRTERVGSDCGKPTNVPGFEYVGAIDFHGEEGFTTAEASRTPLLYKPVFDLVCGGLSIGTTSGGSLPGAMLKVAKKGGPSLVIAQNHAGAPVYYRAHLSEKEGDVRAIRTVAGHLGGGAFEYAPSLRRAHFSAGAPFSGAGTYKGTVPEREARPGKGTWRGSLKVDFPGHRGVRLAGPGFKASIVHAKRTESRG